MDNLAINERLVDFLIHEGVDENELIHYGVRGMRWGKRGAAVGAKVGGHLGAKIGSKAGNVTDLSIRAGKATGRVAKKVGVASVSTIPSGPGAKAARVAKSKQFYEQAGKVALASALTKLAGNQVARLIDKKSPAAGDAARMVTNTLAGGLGLASVAYALSGVSERATAAATKND